MESNAQFKERNQRVARRIPSLPVVMLFVMGLWELLACYVTFDPDFTIDRVNKQFVPISQWFVQIFNTSTDPTVLSGLARMFQVIIGLAEAIIGILLLLAVFVRKHRLALANLGLSLAAALFGAFLLTMFAMHDKNLPAWNQYPAIFAWIGITWMMVKADCALPSGSRPDE